MTDKKKQAKISPDLSKVNFEDSEFEKEEAESIYLTEAELLRINKLIADVNMLKVYSIASEKDLENKNLMISNFQYRIEALQTEIGYIRDILAGKKSKFQDSSKIYQRYIAEIADKYALETGWGFDELTGEISKKITNEI